MKTNEIKLLAHNEMLYNKIVKELIRGNRKIFYSEATGLGKSFIFMKLVKEVFSDSRILYIVPKNAIWENLIHYSDFKLLNGCNISYRTFTSFNHYDFNDEELSSYDVVFVDECHHMLSEIQGANVASYLNDVVSNGGFAFGMTATPYFNGEFVDEKYFTTACYGYDVLEAVEHGLFPKIDMALADINLDEVPNDLKAQFSITGTKTLLEQILDDYSDVTHWLAYFTNKEELESNYEELRKLFPDYRILKLYEGCGNPRDIIREFEESNDKVILLSISMLLEGMHLDNVGGVLLYRNVVTDSTYLQIYGRLCKLGAEKSPVFVDITNSILNIRNIDKFKSSMYTGERKSYEKKDLFDVTSKGYKTIELSEALNSLNSRNWTEEEDAIIRELYPTYGADIVDKLPKRTKVAIRSRAFILGILRDNSWTVEEDKIIREFYPLEGSSICDRLNGRSKGAVSTRAMKLGVSYNKYLPWSEDEENILKTYFLTEKEDICKRLPNRTWLQIRNKAHSFGLKFVEKVKWTEEDDMIIKQYYPIEGFKVVDRLNGISKDSIKIRAKKLGVYYRQAKECWSEEENNILKDNIDVSMDTLCSLLPDRTRASILNKRASLRKELGIDLGRADVFKWTDELDTILKENYPIIGPACVDLIEGATKHAVSYRARQLGLTVEKAVKWSKEEDDILSEYYSKEGLNVRERLNNKTDNNILYRVNKLGIQKRRTIKDWSQEEDSRLLDLYNDNKSLDEISSILDRTKPSVSARLQALGVSRNSKWSKEEIDVLTNNIELSVDELVLLLPERNRTSIANKLRTLKKELNVKNAKQSIWTEEMDNIIRERYPIEGSKCCSMLQGITSVQVSARANHLGVRYVADWTDEEITTLKQIRETYGSNGFTNVAKELFPNRSIGSIYSKLRSLGYLESNEKRIHYTDEELALIDNLIKDGLSLDEIVDRVNSTEYNLQNNVVRTKTALRGLLYDNSLFKVYEDDFNILKDYYPTEGTACFSRLSRNYLNTQLNSALGTLGISKRICTGNWTDEEDNILRKYYSEIGSNVATYLPGRSKSACSVRAKDLGLSYLKYWTKEEDNIILTNLDKTDKQIASLLDGRTATQVAYRKSRLKHGKA